MKKEVIAVDAVDLLTRQHRRIMALVVQIGSAVAAPDELFGELVVLVAMHESVEESVVHPVAARCLPDTAGTAVVEAYAVEGQRILDALARLQELGVRSPEFRPRFDAFASMVSKHFAVEERQEMPGIREHASPAEAGRIAAAVRTVEAFVPVGSDPGRRGSPTGVAPRAWFDRLCTTVRDGVEAA